MKVQSVEDQISTSIKIWKLKVKNQMINSVFFKVFKYEKQFKDVLKLKVKYKLELNNITILN